MWPVRPRCQSLDSENERHGPSRQLKERSQITFNDANRASGTLLSNSHALAQFSLHLED